MLKLLKQTGPSCSACAYATVLSGVGIYIDERQAKIDCKTNSTGTYDHNVCKALNRHDVKNSGVINLNTTFEDYSHWLELNSFNRLLFVSMHGRNKGRRGRPTEEHHSVAVSNGWVYDSTLPKSLPIIAYANKYNHQFKIKAMIMVDSLEFKCMIGI